MDRRRFLRVSGVGIATLSGCVALGGDDEPAETATRQVTETSTATPTATDSPTPEPTPTDTPTATPEPTSRFQGPTREDSEQTDLQWRDYTDAEVAEITAEAETIPYRDLLRNGEEYRRRAVTYETRVVQSIRGERYDIYGLLFNEQDIGFGTWTGSEGYIQGDEIRVWG